MPLGGRSSNRLEMLLNVSVAGLQNFDKLSEKFEKGAVNMQNVAESLQEVEGASNQAEKNFKKFHNTAESIMAVDKKLASAVADLTEKEKRLGDLRTKAAELSHKASLNLERGKAREIEMTGRLSTLYQNLASSGKTAMEILSQGAKETQTELGGLRKNLEATESRLQQLKAPQAIPRSGGEQRNVDKEIQALEKQSQAIQKNITLTEKFQAGQANLAKSSRDLQGARDKETELAKNLAQAYEKIGESGKTSADLLNQKTKESQAEFARLKASLAEAEEGLKRLSTQMSTPAQAAAPIDTATLNNLEAEQAALEDKTAAIGRATTALERFTSTQKQFDTIIAESTKANEEQAQIMSQIKELYGQLSERGLSAMNKLEQGPEQAKVAIKELKKELREASAGLKDLKSLQAEDITKGVERDWGPEIAGMEKFTQSLKEGIKLANAHYDTQKRLTAAGEELGKVNFGLSMSAGSLADSYKKLGIEGRDANQIMKGGIEGVSGDFEMLTGMLKETEAQLERVKSQMAMPAVDTGQLDSGNLGILKAEKAAVEEKIASYQKAGEALNNFNQVQEKINELSLVSQKLTGEKQHLVVGLTKVYEQLGLTEQRAIANLAKGSDEAKGAVHDLRYQLLETDKALKELGKNVIEAEIKGDPNADKTFAAEKAMLDQRRALLVTTIELAEKYNTTQENLISLKGRIAGAETNLKTSAEALAAQYEKIGIKGRSAAEIMKTGAVGAAQDFEKLTGMLKEAEGQLKKLETQMAKKPATDKTKVDTSAAKALKAEHDALKARTEALREAVKMSESFIGVQKKVQSATRSNNKEQSNIRALADQVSQAYSQIGGAAKSAMDIASQKTRETKQDIKGLKESLTETEQSLKALEAKMAQPQATKTSQSKEKSPESNVDAFREEHAALQARAEAIREAIGLSERLIAVQSENARATKEVADANKALGVTQSQANNAEKAVEKLSKKKNELIEKARQLGNVINELSGEAFVEYDEKTKMLTINTGSLSDAMGDVTRVSNELTASNASASAAMGRTGKAQRGAKKDVDDTTEAVEEQGGEWDTLRQRISRTEGGLFGLRRSLGALRNQILVLLFATRIFRETFIAARDATIDYEQALLGLKRMALSTGESLQRTTEVAQKFASSGTINIDATSTSLQNLLATGIGLERAERVLYAMRDAASLNAKGQAELEQAVVRATEAFKNQRAEGLQAVGFTQRLTDVHREYANQLGRGRTELEPLERAMATYNAIMEESVKFQGDNNKWLLTTGGSYTNLQGKIKDTYAAIGDLLNPTVLQLIDRFTRAQEETQAWIKELKELRGEEIDAWGQRFNNIIDAGIKAMGLFASIIGKVASLANGAFVMAFINAALVVKVYNNLMSRTATALTAARKTLNDYTVVLNTNTGAQQVNATATGLQITGLKGLKLAYAANLIEIRRVTIATHTAAMANKQLGLWTYITNGATMMFTTRIKALVAAFKSLGGAAGAAKVAATGLSIVLWKIGLVIAAIIIIPKFIGWLINLKGAADRLIETKQRLRGELRGLQDDFERFGQLSSRTIYDGIALGIDVTEVKKAREQLNNWQEEIVAIENRISTATSESQIKRHKKSLDEVRRYVDEYAEIISQHSHKITKLMQELTDRIQVIEDKAAEARKTELQRLGVSQVVEARKNVQNLLDLEEQFREDLIVIRRRSIVDAERLEKLFNRTLEELQKEAKSTQAEFQESMVEDRRKMIDRTNAMEIELMRESVGRIQAEFDERLRIETREHSKRLDLVEKQRKALEESYIESAEVTRDAFMKSIEGMQGFSNEMKRFLATGSKSAIVASKSLNTAFDLLSKGWAAAKDNLGDGEVLRGFARDANMAAESVRGLKDMEGLDPTVEGLITRIEGVSTALNAWIQVGGGAGKSIEELNALVKEHLGLSEAQFEIWIRLNSAQAARNSSILELSQVMTAFGKVQEELNASIAHEAKLREIANQEDSSKRSIREMQLILGVAGAYDEYQMSIMRAGHQMDDTRQQGVERLKQLEDERSLLSNSIAALQHERSTKTHLQQKEFDEITERLNIMALELDRTEDQIESTRRYNEILRELSKLLGEQIVSQGLLADHTSRMSVVQAELNDRLQLRNQLQQIALQQRTDTLAERELRAGQQFIPVLGTLVMLRREQNNQMSLLNQRHHDNLDNLAQQKAAIDTQIRLEKELLANPQFTEEPARQATQIRIEQLQRQSGALGVVIDKTREAQNAATELATTTARVDFTTALVNQFDPAISKANDFIDSMKKAQNQIILDQQKFTMEQDALLRRREITSLQHNALMLEGQKHFAARQAFERQMMIAGLVRDIGREIAAYAARQAAATGNIGAAIGLLIGAGGIRAMTSGIARDIEMRAQSNYQRAEFAFQQAQRDIMDIGEGEPGGGSTGGSRKFGGTIRAENLVVNISPTVVIQGGQVFIGSGSVHEFSEQMNDLILESTQQAIDNRQIDLSNVPRS